MTLQSELRQRLPGHSVKVTEREGETRVLIERSYSLTISEGQEANVDRIVERVREAWLA